MTLTPKSDRINIGKLKGNSSVVKNLPAGNTGDAGSISGSRRFPGVGMTTHSSIRAWKIPWAEEAGRLQSMRSQRVGHNWACMHTRMHECMHL